MSQAEDYVRRWAGDAGIDDKAVKRIAGHVEKLWDMIGEAEERTASWHRAYIAVDRLPPDAALPR